MACNDEFRRILIKRGSGVPTIPVSDDHQNGDWLVTDLYVGEFYMDTDTGRVYTRTEAGITDATGVSTPTIVTLDLAQINGMNATPEVLISPPATYGVRFTHEVVMSIDDDGTPFIFASGETVQIHNTWTSANGSFMGSYGDGFITTPSGTFQAQPNLSGFEIVTGDITVTSTVAITGGGAGATMVFYLEYELFKL
jgi:hypothetical protein